MFEEKEEEREEQAERDMPIDYCAVGNCKCIDCGWEGSYPVSGCPWCGNSFVE